MSVYAADQLELEEITGRPEVTPVFSGLVTGALFLSPRGPRAAALASVIGAGVSCAYWYGGTFFYNVVLKKGGRY